MDFDEANGRKPVRDTKAETDVRSFASVVFDEFPREPEKDDEQSRATTATMATPPTAAASPAPSGEHFPVGLAMSGGGIRSAAFNLGALQALNACGIFNKIDYASMVSGGGYIGAGTIAAIKRDGMFPFAIADPARCEGGVPEDLKSAFGTKAANAIKTGTADAVAQGPAAAEVADNVAVSRLRDRSQHLRPDGASDVVVSAAIILRGLVVNAIMVAAVVLTLAGLTLVVNPTLPDLSRSVALEMLTAYGPTQVEQWMEKTLAETFFLTMIFGGALIAALAVWGLIRSLVILPRGLSEPGSRPAKIMAGALAALVALAIAEAIPELVGMIIRLRQSGSTLSGIFSWSPEIFAGLAGGTGLLALVWKKLVTQLESLSNDPRWSAFFKAAVARAVLVVLALALPALIVLLFLLLVSAGVKMPGEIDRIGTCPIIAGVFSTLASLVVCFLTPDRTYPFAPEWLSGFSWGTSLATAIVALTVAVLYVVWSHWMGRPQWVRADEKPVRSDNTTERPPFIRKIIAWSPGIAIVLLVILAIFALPNIGAARPGPIGAFYLGTGLAAIALSLFFTGNANSLHRLYRDRLNYAFSMGPTVANATSDTNTPYKLSELTNGAVSRPYPIINAALNIQKDNANKRARNADFFIFTPKWCGSDSTGYIRTEALEAEEPALDLATAAAISGAAVSSAMGRAGVPLLAPTLALLNIRLGYWIRNPQVVLKADELQDAKRKDWRLFYFPMEFFGQLTAKTGKVYLTDGGHIDNLGLFQLLKRRCRVIIVVDAEADPGMQFTSFVDVSRFARIDLGIRIDLPWEELREAALARKAELTAGAPCATAARQHHVAFGRIRYPALTGSSAGDAPIKPEAAFDGLLVYVKSMMTGDEKDYVLDYERRYPRFPHETTGDQFFSEEQYESYRYLGFHGIDEVLGNIDEDGAPTGWETLSSLAKRVRDDASFDPGSEEAPSKVSKASFGYGANRRFRAVSRPAPQPARPRR